jgi:hypothetical protein
MRVYYRNIVFSDHELTRGLKYKDIFQLKPMHLKRAPSSNLLKIFPLLIEYWIESTDSPEIKNPRSNRLTGPLLELSIQSAQVHKLLDLLTSITNYNFFWYGGNDFEWYIPVPENIKEVKNNSRSTVGWGIFYYPEMSDDLKITGFSEKDYSDVTLINDYYYFTHFDKFKNIAFPVSYVSFLDTYFKLIEPTKAKTNAVIKLIKHGIETFHKFKSLSFLSFISAIETLVDEEYRDENKKIVFSCDNCKSLKESPFKCETCGQPVWAVGFKFKEFLKKYISSSPGSITKYNKIYNLRCKIAHSGYLLLGDNNLNVWEKPEKSEKEYITHLETMQLSRLSLFNWILNK